MTTISSSPKPSSGSSAFSSNMPSTHENQQLVVAARVHGEPKQSDWKLENIPTPSEKDLQDNQYLAELVFVSVDPYLRSILNNHPIGTPLTSGCVARVIASKNEKFPQGSHICGFIPWKRIQILNGEKGERKLDESIPLQTSLGVLGMPGMTAFFGLFDVGGLKDGDVVMVSGAAGAVGSLVGQLAKLRGHTVIGSAGGSEKCNHVVKDLGFDACIDYKQYTTAKDVRKQLEKLAPKGIDVYYDNTGGHVTDAIFDVINKYGRVAVCGQISTYNTTDEAPLAPLFLHKIIYKSVTVRGFTVQDFMSRAVEFYKYTTPLVAKGEIKYREHIVDGFEHIPDAFIGLFHGSNTGKTVVRV